MMIDKILIFTTRLKYFVYYLLKTDFKIQRFFRFVKIKYKINYSKQILDIIYSSFKYNISILEYYYFKFTKLLLRKNQILLVLGQCMSSN